MRPFVLLVLVFVLVSSELVEPTEQQKKPDNETVYRVSKQLCFGCIGESIQFLFAHNMVRAAKWELPLMWDSDLERYSRWWASQRKPDCKVPNYCYIYFGNNNTLFFSELLLLK